MALTIYSDDSFYHPRVIYNPKNTPGPYFALYMKMHRLVHTAYYYVQPGRRRTKDKRIFTKVFRCTSVVDVKDKRLNVYRYRAYPRKRVINITPFVNCLTDTPLLDASLLFDFVRYTGVLNPVVKGKLEQLLSTCGNPAAKSAVVLATAYPLAFELMDAGATWARRNFHLISFAFRKSRMFDVAAALFCKRNSSRVVRRCIAELVSQSKFEFLAIVSAARVKNVDVLQRLLREGVEAESGLARGIGLTSTYRHIFSAMRDVKKILGEKLIIASIPDIVRDPYILLDTARMLRDNEVPNNVRITSVLDLHTILATMSRRPNKNSQENLRVCSFADNLEGRQFLSIEFKDPVTIFFPRTIGDLTRMSTELRNCVHSYADRIQSGHSIVLGLKCGYDVVAVIELTQSGCVRQASRRCNIPLDKGTIDGFMGILSSVIR